ncbi:hypothetical protein ACROYT_G009941 [Oculina patagonica]
MLEKPRNKLQKRGEKKESRHEKLKKVESSSASDSSSESCGDSDDARKKKKRKEKDRARRKKEKRKRKREKKEKKRKQRKAREDEKAAAVKSIDKDIAENIDQTEGVETSREPQSTELASEAVPKKRPMVPMTKEEYEKQQAQVRRVYDPETGRHRLVKGTGEILEEIVSRDRHKAINKTATQGDGAFFQANLGLKDK